MKANYHTHTTRCKHAVGTEREYVEAAIANGFTTLGFSDHTPYPFDDNYTTRIRMYMDELGDYINTILTLKEEYKNDIDIYVGLETENFPLFFDQLLNELKRYPLDYLILAGHYYNNGYLKEKYHGIPSDDSKYLADYCSNLIDAMQTGCFTYLAHPDLINYTGDFDTYEKYMRNLCSEANKHHLPVEINLHGILCKKHYPKDVFWKIAAEENCSVVLGLDVHDPDEFNYKPQCDKAMELVNKYQLNLIEDLKLIKPFT